MNGIQRAETLKDCSWILEFIILLSKSHMPFLSFLENKSWKWEELAFLQTG